MRIIDIIGIVIIFLATAYVGYRSSKKVKNSEDFLMAGRSLGKLQAGFSLAATDIGGASIIGAVAYSYSVGMSGSWWNWAATPAYILIGIFLARKLHALALNTGPEFLERRYDKKTRTLASVMQICAGSANLAAQFTVAAVAINVFAGVDQTLALLISAAIVLAYTMGGGLLAVVNTDVLQFVVVMASVLMLLPTSFGAAGGLSGLQAALPESFFRLDSIGFWTPMSWAFMCIFDYSTNQNFLQRMFAAKNRSTARFAYLFTGCNYLLLGFIMSVIALCAAVVMPGVADGNSVYPLMIKQLLPAGLCGVALGGVFCAAMSTADSKLIATTQLFVQDIYLPFINKDADDKQILRVSRIVTLLSCVGAIVISLLLSSLIQMIYIAGLFYSAAVFYPMILGIFNKRLNARGAFISMIVTIAVGALSHFYLLPQGFTGILGLPSNILASTVGLLALLVVSYFTSPPSEEKTEVVRIAKNA